jgi:hypothetical protein
MLETNVLLLVITVVTLASFQNILLLIVAKLGSKDIRLLLQYMARTTERIFEKIILLLSETLYHAVFLVSKLTPTAISSLLVSLIEVIRKKYS